MERKIRVAAVDYLNTKPLIYGFEKGLMKNELEITMDYPSNIAKMLINDEVDIALVPVSILPRLKEYHIISDYCIGCDGEVASVCLFSDVSIDKIENIILDYQSSTSVSLCKILIKNHWKIFPEFIKGKPGYEASIKGTTAGLVIGDRALKQRKPSTYIYDLGYAWKEMMGLPFVFAAWISNKILPAEFIRSFNTTTGIGINNLREIVAANPFDPYDLYYYYTQNISYQLDNTKREALEIFLELGKKAKV